VSIAAVDQQSTADQADADGDPPPRNREWFRGSADISEDAGRVALPYEGFSGLPKDACLFRSRDV
jgi:hypothetical protein